MAARKKKTDADLVGSLETYKMLSDEDWQPETLLDQFETALNNNFDVRAVDSLDEREIPRYANFYEFCRRGLNVKPFPRQLQVVMQTYGEICMFCSDQQVALNMFDQDINEIMEKVSFMRFGKCPRCGKTRLDMIVHKKWMFPNRLALLVGQRSGKNFTLGMTSLYQDHLFLTLENEEGRRVAPYEYFGMLPTFVRQAFTGVTAQQAYDNIWDQIVSLRNESPWYRTYFDFLRYHGQKSGQELFKISDTFISYNHKRMGSTIKVPDKGKLRGATRYFTGVDEICWFNSNLSDAAEKKVGDVREVWTSLNNSLRTIRNEADRLIRAGRIDVPNAISMDISSPFDINDILSQHLREARSNARVSTGHYATWEFNPRYTQESLAEEFVKDPEIAWRDFGAIPPLAITPWISDPKAVIDVVRQTPDPAYVSLKKHSEVNKYGDSTSWYELLHANMSGAGRLIAIDNGLVNNAFACTIASLLAGGKVRIDCSFMLKPSATGEKVNLDKMYSEFVQPLARKINAVAVVYDHWNSIQAVQNLRDSGIDARQYTLNGNDFSALRSAIFSGTVSFPFSEFPLNTLLDRSADVDLVQTSWDKPHFSLVLQTLTVREVAAGKVVKPKYGDDDVFRTMALAHAFCVNPEFVMKLQRGGFGAGASGPHRAIGAVGFAGSGSNLNGGRGSGRLGSYMCVGLQSRGRGR